MKLGVSRPQTTPLPNSAVRKSTTCWTMDASVVGPGMTSTNFM